MQKKVSRKSLLITLLGILLVVSLAFTTTLAAFTANATVSGTIRFQGSLEIRATGTAVTGHTSGEVITGTVDGSVWGIDMIVTVASPTSTIALDTTDALSAGAVSNLTSVTLDGKGLAFAYTITLCLDSEDVHSVTSGSTTYAFAITAVGTTNSGAGAGAVDSSDAKGKTAKWTGTVAAGASAVTFTMADLLADITYTIDNSKLHFTNGDVDDATATLIISLTTAIPTP